MIDASSQIYTKNVVLETCINTLLTNKYVMYLNFVIIQHVHLLYLLHDSVWQSLNSLKIIFPSLHFLVRMLVLLVTFRHSF